MKKSQDRLLCLSPGIFSEKNTFASFQWIMVSLVWWFVWRRLRGEVQPNVLLIIAFVSLLVSAGSYFFAKIKILSFTLFLFYTCNTFLSSLLFLNHPLLFCIIGIFFIALPIICLILFALDTHYALFCIDTSFVFMIVWPFIAMFFFINLICYLFHVIHA